MILCLFFGGFLQVIQTPHSSLTTAHFFENFMARVVMMRISACIQFIRLKAPKTAIGVCEFIQDLEDFPDAIGLKEESSSNLR